MGSQSSSQQAQDRKVGVFVSSTFRDKHAARDHLVTVVFPELRECVEQLGLEFFDVDLRWGVPERPDRALTARIRPDPTALAGLYHAGLCLSTSAG